VKKSVRRTPKNYDGTGVTTHQVCDLLPAVLSKIEETYREHPDLVLAFWPEVIGPQLSHMTQAVSFADGVLTVKVKNSTLHSLLSGRDKAHLLERLKQKFPKTRIQNIVFRIA
jgi:hypothetical protein